MKADYFVVVVVGAIVVWGLLAQEVRQLGDVAATIGRGLGGGSSAMFVGEMILL